MKCSTILFIVILSIFCSYNISKNVLGYWSIVVYVSVSILSFYLLHCCTKNCENINDFPNLWPQFKRNIFSNIAENNKNENVEQLTMCLICNDLDCSRHDSEFKVFLQPWKHLLIDSKVNLELEELFDFLLNKYTTSWLDNISYNNGDILFEFKQLIKLLASSFIIRVKDRLKLNEIIITKLPKFLMHHLEMYIYGKRKAKSARFLEESVLKEYGNLLHPALTSPENEMKYLKSIANLIIYTTLPQKYIRCDVSVTFLNEFISCCILSPLIEIFIDPDKINMLLICLLEKNEVKKIYPEESNLDKVEFLNGFSNNVNNQPSNCLGIELKQILEDQHLLFLFTQYSKEEYFTNFLQFRMHMNLFLTRIINPDLQNKQLKELFQDLTNIYNLYIVKTSNDQIQFSESIQQDFYKIINGNYLDIQQFRNCKSLYESYEHVNEVLHFYCQKFFYTDVYLKLVCGQRSLSFNMGDDCSSIFENNNSNSGQSDLNLDLDSTGYSSGKTLDHFDVVKDLSNWRISILQIITRIDPASGRECYYFEIEVTNLDEGSTKWTVERQLNEFYILESKLKEFHGEEMDNIILPTKKPFSKVSKNAMENYRYDFEKFLKSLLGNITLKRSELIYNFLSSTDFTSNCFMENFKFSKMIKNVPSKFSKERGQHLYSFLKNFVTLSEKSNKSVHSDGNNKEYNDTEGTRRKSRRSLAQSDIDFDSFDDVNAAKSNCDRVYAQIEYIYDYILLLLIRFYNLNNWILQCLYLIRPLVRQSFQGFCLYFVGRQLRDTLFTSNKMAELIANLKKSLDSDVENASDVDPNLNDILNLSKSQRSQLALKLATDFIPKWFIERISIDFNKHEEIVFLIFSMLQNRLLNKQLLFVILDSIFADLFPPVLYPIVDNLASASSTKS